MSTREEDLREEYDKKVVPSLSRCIKIFLNAFSVAYSIRGGISFLLNLFKCIKNNKINDIFSILNINPEDSLRWGLFIGFFCGGYDGLKAFLFWLRGKKDHFNTLLAGFLGGLSILFLGNQKGNLTRPIALYLMARALQCGFNSIVARGWWKFPGSDWNHYDSLFFVLATTQCFYAYYMRPDSLSPGYLKFVETLSPVHPIAMKSVLECTRGLPVENWKEVNEWAKKVTFPNVVKQPLLTGPYPTIIPCSIVHPQTSTCMGQQFYTLRRAVKLLFPIYLTINFVPMVVTRFWSLLRNPALMIYRGVYSSARSTLFMTMISMISMGLSCLVRKVFVKDTRFKFFLICFLSPWPIMIESKTKRTEFALYMFPRAVESFYKRMTQKNIISDIPRGSTILFCFTISFLMYFREYEPATLSNMLRSVFNTFLPKSL